MRNLVPIGRFAVIARLSVKALRHYDELGLLRPALVDAATGYRYYSAAQATDAERIRLLRALEVPLDEIAAILRERDAAALRARLERHRARLEARVEEDCRRIAALVRLSEEEKPMTHDIALRAIEAQPVLGRRERAPLASLGAAAGRAFGEIYGYLGAIGARPAGTPLAVYHSAPDEGDVVDVEWCVPTERVLAGRGPLEGRELPAATAACARHEGPYDEVGPCYGALTAWIQAHGHEEAGPPREVYLVGPGPGVAATDLRTEVQWPVR